MHPQLGRVAQLVQSTWFTPKGSGVRIPSRPLQKPTFSGGFFRVRSGFERPPHHLAPRCKRYTVPFSVARPSSRPPSCSPSVVGFLYFSGFERPGTPGSSLQKVHCTFCGRSALFAPIVKSTFQGWIFCFHLINKLPNRFLDSLLHERLL